MSIYEERYELAKNRIADIEREESLSEPLLSYFQTVSSFAVMLTEVMDRSLGGLIGDISEVELREENHRLYRDVLPENYEKSYANPDYITSVFEKAEGLDDYKLMSQCLSFLYTEIRGLIPAAFEGRLEIFTIYLELFIEIYGMFEMAACENSYPHAASVRKTIYWFESDNCDIVLTDRIRDQLDPSRDFALNILMNEDLNNTRYLYLYGEYISDDELETARYLSSLSEEEIDSMATTFTSGYRIGFIKAGKPLDRKKTVNVRFRLGFERISRRAIENFKDMGLESIVYRAASLSLNKKSMIKIGYEGASPNRQYDFDHKDDDALYFDADFSSRKYGVLKESYEEMKELANTHAGPAVQEVFGEAIFTPVTKAAAITHSDKSRKISTDYTAKASELVNKYIIGEERSFTIIAYPLPSIVRNSGIENFGIENFGIENFGIQNSEIKNSEIKNSDIKDSDIYKKIFSETVKLNTLDYKLYEDIQQRIIDVLDKADYVHIKGKGDNQTDLKVSLYKLDDPKKETKFENCVADVNIPVGEVFTSPVLKGTSGRLHVTGVYLNELFYENLDLLLEDGLIKEYSVTNFDSEEENKKFVMDNLLFNHKTLPIGEFAIGTNTVAYRMTKDYNIGALLPILIGEKTGPHFAFGDTCYSHEEEVRVFNPDGKEIVAKENECSRLRNTNPKEAYFQCHTDVTIPYDELGFIHAVTPTGEIAIFEDGEFKVEGCEELNKPLKD